MSESDSETKGEVAIMSTEDIAMKFAEFLRTLQTTPITTKLPAVNVDSLGEVVVSTKLSGDNYPLWANLIRRAIGGKGLSSHISKDTSPPAESDPEYESWQRRDHCVFGWIINNMEPDLVNEVSQYPTARELWEGLAITYGSGGDAIQIYDLHRRASNIKQGDQTLEQLWNRLQSLWMSIDRRKPNPMKCPEDIGTYNREKQETRLFQFLMSLNDTHETTRREILKRTPYQRRQRHMQPSGERPRMRPYSNPEPQKAQRPKTVSGRDSHPGEAEGDHRLGTHREMTGKTRRTGTSWCAATADGGNTRRTSASS